MMQYRFLREGEDILNKEGTKVVNYKEVNLIAASEEEAFEKIARKNHGHYVCIGVYSLNENWT